MTITVETARSNYPVQVTRGARAQLPAFIPDGAKVAIIHPVELEHLAQQIGADLNHVLIPVPQAEAAKTAGVLEDCWRRLAEAGFTRHDVVLGLGGGTTTDLAGFVAATWLRGVGYISMPTTVLAMVDAAVGGKTGINLPAGKNLVGAFYEPIAVLCDLDLLSSLSAEEVRAGLAEVIKCGFISDPEILRLAHKDLNQCQDVSTDRFAEIARRAIQVKADVVAGDLTERTSSGDQVGREALNYGHTLGHAIEAHQGFRIRHGEAISIGMVWMAHVSRDLLGLDASALDQHRELLGGLGLPLSYDSDAWPELRAAMGLDKKSRGSTLRLVGLPEIGRTTIVQAPDEQVLASCYAELGG